jgi:hypothetical protein
MAKGFFDQKPAGAYRNNLVYGEKGFRGQSQASGPHASNFRVKGMTSPSQIGAPGGGQPPKSFKLTRTVRN